VGLEKLGEANFVGNFSKRDRVEDPEGDGGKTRK
jgi:hypothetical protein